jgi:uncharacterized hydrophobic protein (TIGR00271 family)
MTPIRTLWYRLLHWRRDHLVAQCDRVAVLDHVAEAATLAPRYAFMTVMSCGIATLGLLQDSVAVIIGAMLISPLMAPIIELGMGLATFDFVTVRSALKTLAVGLVLSLATAIAIVAVSPLQEATAEILARTEPTLFDLLVAVFSGLAGAYATITRKGETIVGVAIATALMPPLAVVGFGVAVGNMHVAGGAAFLFMTNLLAIALSATIVAKLYGFGAGDTPKQSAWKATLILATFVLLSIPLGLGLRKIAAQALVETTVRQALDRAAQRTAGRITTVRVTSIASGIDIDAVLMTPTHVPGLGQYVQAALHDQLSVPVRLNLREVLTTSDAAVAREQASIADLRDSVEKLRSAAITRSNAARELATRDAALRDRLLAQFATIETSDGDPVVRLRLRADSGITLARAFALEHALQAGNAMQPVQVLPALLALPPVPFVGDAIDFDATALQVLALDAWAIRRLRVARVRLIAHARSERIATQRAAAAAAWLRAQAVEVGTVRTQVDRHTDAAANTVELLYD